VSRRSTGLVLVAILLLSLNLRTTAVSVGPVLDEVRAALGMNAATAGLLTSLPVIAFAVFGALAPTLGRLVGTHRVVFLALVCTTLGLAGRALVGNEVAFLLLSLLSLGGMAVANVLLPSLVRLHFPDRIGQVTAVYTTSLSVGLTAAFILTVPVSHAAGSFRWGLGVWAVVALVAAGPWLGLLRHDVHSGGRPASAVRFGDIARTRLGWAMAALFGLQSIQAYAVYGWFATLWRDAGFSAGTAGLLVGIVAGMSIPLSFIAPPLMARPGDQRWVLYAAILCYPVSYAALAIAPRALSVPGAIVLGAGMTTFPVVLTLIGLRARTPGATAALSAFTQSVGYLIAAIGPFGTGLLHDLSGGWTVPLVVLAALSLPLLGLAAYVGRPAYVEDQLAGGGLDSEQPLREKGHA
jgi:MFS transporter, CP family, cyanate transporter